MEGFFCYLLNDVINMEEYYEKLQIKTMTRESK